MYISERDGFTLLVCGGFCLAQGFGCVVGKLVGSGMGWVAVRVLRMFGRAARLCSCHRDEHLS